MIYFTTNSYDNTVGGLVSFAEADPSGASGQGVTTGIISYTAPTTGLGSYIPVVIAKTGNDFSLLQGGTIANVSGNAGSTYLVLNHNGEGQKILAFTISAGVTQYLAGLIFGPDTWQTSGSVVNYWDSYNPLSTYGSTYTTDLSGLWSSDSLSSFVTQGNQNAVLNTCQTTLAGIVNPTNWVADGNIPKPSAPGVSSTTTLGLESGPLAVCANGSAGWTGTLPPSNFNYTPTPSGTPSNTETYSPTETPSDTATETITGTSTNTPQVTSTPSNSPTQTASFTVTSTLTNSPTATVTNTPLPNLTPGSIAFTGFVQNGSSEFAFVAPSGLSASQVVYFTNEGYDNTIGNLFINNATVAADSTTIVETIISYTAPTTGLGSYVPVVISKVANDPNLLQGGTASGNLTLNHNGLGHKILAFTVSAGVTEYVAGLIFGPDSWLPNATEPVTFYDSNLPPGLSSTTTTDLSSAWNSNSLESVAAEGNDNAVLNTCESTLSAVVNPSNWVVDGNIPTYSASKPTASLGLDSGPLVVCASGSAGWTGTMPPTNYDYTSTPTNTPTETATDTPTPTPSATP